MHDVIVVGGGVALVRCVESLTNFKAAGDEQIGVNIVRECLTAPLRQIVKNAGANPGVALHKVLEKGGSWGYNADTAEYTDLVKAGVIDPTKVVRTALQNAASVAGLLLTTEAMVAEKPEEKPATPGMPPGGMGGMGGMM